MDTKSNLYRAYLIRTIGMLFDAACNIGHPHWLKIDHDGALTFGKVSDTSDLESAYANFIIIKEYHEAISHNDSVAFYCMQAIDKLNTPPVIQHVPGQCPLTQAEKQIGLTDKIGAIKAIRTRTGFGLKDAKDAFDKWWAEEGHT